MQRNRFLVTGLLASAVLIFAATLWAQQPATGPTPVHLLVTAEPKHGADVPVIKRDDVQVFEKHDRDNVTDWVPAQGDAAALELFIMLDDSLSTRVGSQLEELEKFISSQPDTTKVGVAYMQNGIARIVQTLTSDHAQAAKALRLPMGIGGADASPYFSISDLVKRWPESAARHEVLIVTDGIDRYYGTGDLENPDVDAAVDDAARAGVVISAIYNPGAGHFGHSYWQTYWGQIYLSQITDKTGGEAYYLGMSGEAVSFSPFLEDFSRRLEHQYLLSFIPKPQKKAGWQKVRLNCEVPNVDLVSAGRVYVKPEP